MGIGLREEWVWRTGFLSWSPIGEGKDSKRESKNLAVMGFGYDD